MISRSLPPPNRACGFPAHGSPVGGSPPTGLTNLLVGCGHREQPTLGKERHVPPFTPSSSAVSIRSVQTHGSVHDQRPRMSSACLAFAGTVADDCSLHPSFTYSTFLRPLAPPELPGFHATTAALTSARLSADVQISLLHVHGLPTIPSPNTQCSPAAALTRYPSALRVRPKAPDFTIEWQARQSTRPNRVRQPTDWPFISGCFPPRLTATQLPSIMGRRTHTQRGLAPLKPSTPTGAPFPRKRESTGPTAREVSFCYRL